MPGLSIRLLHRTRRQRMSFALLFEYTYIYYFLRNVYEGAGELNLIESVHEIRSAFLKTALTLLESIRRGYVSRLHISRDDWITFLTSLGTLGPIGLERVEYSADQSISIAEPRDILAKNERVFLAYKLGSHFQTGISISTDKIFCLRFMLRLDVCIRRFLDVVTR